MIQFTKINGKIVMVPEWWAEMMDPYFHKVQYQARAEWLAMIMRNHKEDE